MIKRQLLLFVSLLFCFSCASQKKEIIVKSNIKLEGINTNIRNLIEIDGYYVCPDYPQYGSYMFFEDGTWVYFHFKRNLSENEIRADMSEAVRSWIEDKQLRWGSYWGVYKIENDMLIVHSYDKGNFLKPWRLGENRYRIIDRETVQRIYYRGLLKADESSYEIYSPWIDNQILHFTSADSLPSSDNWLKEEQWIWRNEQDWKNYMEKVKQKKKK